MEKINKNFFIFTFITSFLSVSLLFILYKLVPIFFTHTVYYCQQLINSYSIKVPQQISVIAVAFVATILFAFLARISVTLIKMQKMKNLLIKNKKGAEDIHILIKKVGLNNKVSIIKDAKPFAFCLGIRNPHIYISTKTVSIMTKRQLTAILLHEKYHLEHLDSLTLLIASLPQLLFPFFPLLPRFLEYYKIEREIRADRKAVNELGTIKPVIEALRKLLDYPWVSPVFTSSIADTDTLEIRIKSLLDKKTQSQKIRKADFLISILSLSVVLVSVVAPVRAVELHKGKMDTMMVCLENNACAKWCEEHNTVVPYKTNMSYPYSSIR